MEKFWLVWRIDGDSPSFRHASLKTAKAEAERLARANPGCQFYVLSAESRVRIQEPLEWEELSDGITF